ncbi:MAG: septum formation family protein [Renibacterium sp.]|nr:septum formation family protein [Renibacterium sp.]
MSYRSTPATFRASVPAAGALLLGLLLSGCGLIGGNDAQRDPSGTVTASSTADAFTIKVGDCVNEPEGTTFSEIVAIPCDQPHDLEAYASTKLPDGDFPGRSAIGDKVDEFCDPKFLEFVGIAYNDSSLSSVPFTPTSESWSGGDREIVCLVGQEKTKTTGTLKASNK